MGFDIYGLNPKLNTEEKDILKEDFNYLSKADKQLYIKEKEVFEKANPGTYFRNNVWWWRPLWEYVCLICTEVMREEDIIAGDNNSGHIIPEKITTEMSVLLGMSIKNNDHIKYEESYKERIESLPMDRCNLCHGTGKRNDSFFKGECNKCRGEGVVSNFATNYPFHAKNVENFFSFISECGGMQIF